MGQNNLQEVGSDESMAELRYLVTYLFFLALIFTVVPLIQVTNPSFDILTGFDLLFYGGEVVAIMIACGVPFIGGGTCAVAIGLTSLIGFFVITNVYINILFVILNIGLAYIMMRLSKGGG